MEEANQPSNPIVMGNEDVKRRKKKNRTYGKRHSANILFITKKNRGKRHEISFEMEISICNIGLP